VERLRDAGSTHSGSQSSLGLSSPSIGSQDNLRDSRGALMTTGRRPPSRAGTSNHDSMSSQGLMAPESSKGHISLGRALHMGTDEADELLGKVRRLCTASLHSSSTLECIVMYCIQHEFDNTMAL
jgi:hypothetical protein